MLLTKYLNKKKTNNIGFQTDFIYWNYNNSQTWDQNYYTSAYELKIKEFYFTLNMHFTTFNLHHLILCLSTLDYRHFKFINFWNFNIFMENFNHILFLFYFTKTGYKWVQNHQIDLIHYH